jgi:hypothetical protein
MNSSPPTLSPEEQEQILQTIEMFEVIVQANPQDTQSMEILKDAYLRLGMKKEMLTITKRLAETFTQIGQFSTAMLEYEHILRNQPDDVETIAAMGELEERMNKATRKGKTGGLDVGHGPNAETGTLITTSATMQPAGFGQGGPGAAATRIDDITAGLSEDGNQALAKFLIQHRLAPEEIVAGALDRSQKRNQALPPSTLASSLIDEIVKFGGADLEGILCGILERTKFAYIPLEYYDVDRQVVRMLPESITLSRLIVPFDVMSRTVMVATANPFDALGKDAAQQLLDYSIQWHLASPVAISRVLQQAYRLGESGVNRELASVMSAPPSANPMPNVSAAAVPLPAIKVAATSAPLQPEESVSTGPLPDTAAFRLNP